MTPGERDTLISAMQRQSADVVVSTLAIALKEKSRSAHEAGRHREAELLMEQGLILLNTLSALREIGERLDSLRLV